MNPMTDWLTSLFVFLLGLEFGSFANVCIYRWPRSSSVMRPRRSFCPWCGHQILWADNIPVVSYLLLRARCRHCASPISARYPLVELSMAVLWVAAYRAVAPEPEVLQILFLAGVLTFLFVAVVTTLTDLDWKVIPDEASATLVVTGLLTAAGNPILGEFPMERIAHSALGLFVAGGAVWMIGQVGGRLLGREAMGGGDVKLMAGMGTVLGWHFALYALFLGSIIGGLAAMAGMMLGRLKRGDHIPFGPFLNMGGAILLFALLTGGELKAFLLRIWM